VEVNQIRGIKNRLHHYLQEFSDCFSRKDTRAHLKTYVSGQMSNLERKSVEPIALEAGMPARTLQEFLSQHSWDHDRMRDQLQALVVGEHGGANSIGLIDETSYVKKGDKTPGVQRQWCGAAGKKENCVVSVHLGYTSGDFHCLLDSDLFLPEKSWSEDRARCREAGIPDEVVHRPKTEMALELYDRARANGVEFEWLTFDAGYGGKPPFLRQLDAREQVFVGEVPVNFYAWGKRPRVSERAYRRHGHGRGLKTPRLVAGSAKPSTVQSLLADHRALGRQPWQCFRVKDGEKGPMLWEVKHMLIYPPNEAGLPDRTYHLVAARSVLAPEKVKYFVSNAPPETAVEVLLLVAFSRWRIERCFQDDKGQLGLDHYEGRRWLGWQRHLILSAVSFLFLARVHQALREKKSAPDPVPGAYSGFGSGANVVVERVQGDGAVREDRTQDSMAAETQRPGAQKSYQKDTTNVAPNGYSFNRGQAMPMALT
jgi:SRSO17 transposase